MSTPAEAARNYVLAQLKAAYVYGGTGQRCTPKYRQARMAQYPKHADAIQNNCPVLSGRQTSCSGCKHDGELAFDCAQLSRRAAEAAGIAFPSGSTSQWRNVQWAITGTIDTLPPELFAFLYRVRPDGSVPHTGTYTGDEYTVDARGHASGVVHEKLGKYPWTHWGIPEGMYPPEVIAELKELTGGNQEVDATQLLQQGDRGERVKEMQERLIKLGISVGDRTQADGIFGPATRRGVEEFQRRYGLPVRGTWGAAEDKVAMEKEAFIQGFFNTTVTEPPAAQQVDITALLDECDGLIARLGTIARIFREVMVVVPEK